jgi:hypothetical protein
MTNARAGFGLKAIRCSRYPNQQNSDRRLRCSKLETIIVKKRI